MVRLSLESVVRINGWHSAAPVAILARHFGSSTKVGSCQIADGGCPRVLCALCSERERKKGAGIGTTGALIFLK
ncbi:hypothetical protein R6Q59_032328 [Mikania micrantha]